jgi:hypothetical protein
MPAFTRTEPYALVVIFYRDNEPAEVVFANDGDHAWSHALHLITKREKLQAGDTITVRRPGEEPAVLDLDRDLPEFSRSSHSSAARCFAIAFSAAATDLLNSRNCRYSASSIFGAGGPADTASGAGPDP